VRSNARKPLPTRKRKKMSLSGRGEKRKDQDRGGRAQGRREKTPIANLKVRFLASRGAIEVRTYTIGDGAEAI